MIDMWKLCASEDTTVIAVCCLVSNDISGNVKTFDQIKMPLLLQLYSQKRY